VIGAPRRLNDRRAGQVCLRPSRQKQNPVSASARARKIPAQLFIVQLPALPLQRRPLIVEKTQQRRDLATFKGRFGPPILVNHDLSHEPNPTYRVKPTSSPAGMTA
jgi:hypothetical protein